MSIAFLRDAYDSIGIIVGMIAIGGFVASPLRRISKRLDSIEKGLAVHIAKDEEKMREVDRRIERLSWRQQ